MKSVKWQIPFVSHSGVGYRIDIYADDYVGSPIQLYGGPNPIVTDEDDSDDYFEAVRGGSGTIEICTKMPNGQMLSLSDILPQNNIDKPFKLIRTSDDKVCYIGFLSCDAYTQDYTGIPQILSLPIISALDAMDSVELDSSIGFKQIFAFVLYAMKKIETEAGITIWDRVYISHDFDYIKDALIYPNMFLETEENTTDEKVVVEMHGVSCRSLLESIAKFLGATVRMAGRDLFLIAYTAYFNSEDEEWYSYLMYLGFEDLYESYFVYDEEVDNMIDEYLYKKSMNALQWMGNDHTMSVRQGYRNISISAKLQGFSLDMGLQECPKDWLAQNPSGRWSQWGKGLVNTNFDFYSLYDFKCWNINGHGVKETNDYYLQIDNAQRVTDSLKHFRNLWFQSPNIFDNIYQIRASAYTGNFMQYGSAVFGYVERNGEQFSGLLVTGMPRWICDDDGSHESGFMKVQNPLPADEENYVLKITSADSLGVATGTMKLKLAYKFIQSSYGLGWEEKIPYPNSNKKVGIMLALRVGDKWYNSTTNTFGNSYIPFYASFDNALEMELSIPITQMLNGQAVIYIFPFLNGGNLQNWHEVFGIFLTQLDLIYEPVVNPLLNDRSSNDYYTPTGAKFDDDLRVNLDLASYANNNKQASLLWAGASTPLQKEWIRYRDDDWKLERPEKALLEDLKRYYSKPKTLLSLQVKPEANMPITMLDGFDGKIYVPLAESVDYKEDRSTIKCFEMNIEE